MRIVGIVVLVALYLTCNAFHWKHARHYEPKFRWMNFRDFVEGWDAVRFSAMPNFSKALFVVWLLAGVALTTW